MWISLVTGVSTVERAMNIAYEDQTFQQIFEYW